tara:strand:- start:767 stop:3112 length:2346 start_codon:yes stop_codon:yes gene_type:complete
MKCLTKLCVSLSLLLGGLAGATDFTVGTSSVLDLRNQSGTSQWSISDDGRSGAINLGFTFGFYGNEYTQGYMATNGCWSFTTAYCNDYTPDPLPDTVYTIYPFWTDLIRDNGSRMLTKYFDNPSGDDYFIAGWYDLREYHRDSDNTFEMWLYENSNNIEFRYEELNINRHDVLIGIQGSSTEYEQYLFHDECSTGSTNSSSCVSTDWNNTSHNTTLENKSLMVGVDITAQCSANPLYSVNCNGYALAYFNQQCGVDALYDTDCTGYNEAFIAQQCTFDSLYHTSCSGYESALAQQQAIEDSYMIEEEYDDGHYNQEEYDMYGYSTDDMYMSDGYDSEEEFYGYEEETWEDPYYDQYYYEEDLESFEAPYEEEITLGDPEYLYEPVWIDMQFDPNADEFVVYDIDSEYEDVYVAQLDQDYIFEDMAITENWLAVEDDWLEDEALEELEPTLLEEQAEEVLEDLAEIVEETELLFIEDEALEDLIDEEELELLINEEAYEELIEEDNLEAIQEQEEALIVEEEPGEILVRSGGSTSSSRVSFNQAVAVALKSVRDTGTQVMGSSGSGESLSASEDDSSGGFLRDQEEQSLGIQAFQAAEIGPEIAASPFEVAEQQQEQQGQDEFMFEDGGTFTQSDIQFEDDFNEAIAVGGDIGTFLSQQDPDFGRFDIAPPTVNEQRISQAVESLADQIGSEAAQENLQEQLDSMMQDGGFDTDQTAAVAFMGYREGFSQYTGMIQIPDKSSWYLSTTMYAEEDVQDNNFSFYMMAGKSQKKINEMTDVEYN